MCVLKANCFAKLAKPPTICKVVGKNVLDGLGLPTLQVEIFCTIQNFPKVRSSLNVFFTVSWLHCIYCLNCRKLMFWNSAFVKYIHTHVHTHIYPKHCPGNDIDLNKWHLFYNCYFYFIFIIKIFYFYKIFINIFYSFILFFYSFIYINISICVYVCVYVYIYLTVLQLKWHWPEQGIKLIFYNYSLILLELFFGEVKGLFGGLIT